MATEPNGDNLGGQTAGKDEAEAEPDTEVIPKGKRPKPDCEGESFSNCGAKGTDEGVRPNIESDPGETIELLRGTAGLAVGGGTKEENPDFDKPEDKTEFGRTPSKADNLGRPGSFEQGGA